MGSDGNDRGWWKKLNFLGFIVAEILLCEEKRDFLQPGLCTYIFDARPSGQWISRE